MQPPPLHKAAHVVELSCLLRLCAFSGAERAALAFKGEAVTFLKGVATQTGEHLRCIVASQTCSLLGDPSSAT